MLKQLLIDNAIYILFPGMKKYQVDYKDYGINSIKLPLTDMLYEGFPENDHHFLYKYTYENVLPLICKICNIQFDINEFKLVPNIVKHNNKDYDFSYLVPKENKYLYKIDGYEYNVSYKTDYYGLMQYNNKHIEGLFKTTEYHKVYAFPHSCSKIINYTSKTNKKLFISGDSQMIPAIAPLSIYFKEIYYFDNRTNPYKSFKSRYRFSKIDNVIVELYNNSLTTYLDKNIN